jgi:hypothetical protein
MPDDPLTALHRNVTETCNSPRIRWKPVIAAKGPTVLSYVRFEVFTAGTTKDGVFWDVTPCGH